MHRIHRTDIQVRFGDTDALGHLNNAAYASYAELGRLEFFRQFGPAVTSLILAHLGIDFRRQVVFGEEVHLDTWVTHMGRSSVNMRHALVASGSVAAEIRAVVVLFDYAAQTPRELPADLRALLAPYVAAPREPVTADGPSPRS
jgi:acyl-CoA thioester hydrolase